MRKLQNYGVIKGTMFNDDVAKGFDKVRDEVWGKFEKEKNSFNDILKKNFTEALVKTGDKNFVDEMKKLAQGDLRNLTMDNITGLFEEAGKQFKDKFEDNMKNAWEQAKRDITANSDYLDLENGKLKAKGINETINLGLGVAKEVMGKVSENGYNKLVQKINDDQTRLLFEANADNIKAILIGNKKNINDNFSSKEVLNLFDVINKNGNELGSQKSNLVYSMLKNVYDVAMDGDSKIGDGSFFEYLSDPDNLRGLVNNTMMKDPAINKLINRAKQWKEQQKDKVENMFNQYKDMFVGNLNDKGRQFVNRFSYAGKILDSESVKRIQGKLSNIKFKDGKIDVSGFGDQELTDMFSDLTNELGEDLKNKAKDYVQKKLMSFIDKNLNTLVEKLGISDDVPVKELAQFVLTAKLDGDIYGEGKDFLQQYIDNSGIKETALGYIKEKMGDAFDKTLKQMEKTLPLDISFNNGEFNVDYTGNDPNIKKVKSVLQDINTITGGLKKPNKEEILNNLQKYVEKNSEIITKTLLNDDMMKKMGLEGSEYGDVAKLAIQQALEGDFEIKEFSNKLLKNKKDIISKLEGMVPEKLNEAMDKMEDLKVNLERRMAKMQGTIKDMQDDPLLGNIFSSFKGVSLTQLKNNPGEAWVSVRDNLSAKLEEYIKNPENARALAAKLGTNLDGMPAELFKHSIESAIQVFLEGKDIKKLVSDKYNKLAGANAGKLKEFSDKMTENLPVDFNFEDGNFAIELKEDTTKVLGYVGLDTNKINSFTDPDKLKDYLSTKRDDLKVKLEALAKDKIEAMSSDLINKMPDLNKIGLTKDDLKNTMKGLLQGKVEVEALGNNIVNNLKSDLKGKLRVYSEEEFSKINNIRKEVENKIKLAGDKLDSLPPQLKDLVSGIKINPDDLKNGNGGDVWKSISGTLKTNIEKMVNNPENKEMLALYIGESIEGFDSEILKQGLGTAVEVFLRGKDIKKEVMEKYAGPNANKLLEKANNYLPVDFSYNNGEIGISIENDNKLLKEFESAVNNIENIKDDLYKNFKSAIGIDLYELKDPDQILNHGALRQFIKNKVEAVAKDKIQELGTSLMSKLPDDIAGIDKDTLNIALQGIMQGEVQTDMLKETLISSIEDDLKDRFEGKINLAKEKISGVRSQFTAKLNDLKGDFTQLPDELQYITDGINFDLDSLKNKEAREAALAEIKEKLKSNFKELKNEKGFMEELAKSLGNSLEGLDSSLLVDGLSMAFEVMVKGKDIQETIMKDLGGEDKLNDLLEIANSKLPVDINYKDGDFSVNVTADIPHMDSIQNIVGNLDNLENLKNLDKDEIMANLKNYVEQNREEVLKSLKGVMNVSEGSFGDEMLEVGLMSMVEGKIELQNLKNDLLENNIAFIDGIENLAQDKVNELKGKLNDITTNFQGKITNIKDGLPNEVLTAFEGVDMSDIQNILKNPDELRKGGEELWLKIKDKLSKNIETLLKEQKTNALAKLAGIATDKIGSIDNDLLKVGLETSLQALLKGEDVKKQISDKYGKIAQDMKDDLIKNSIDKLKTGIESRLPVQIITNENGEFSLNVNDAGKLNELNNMVSNINNLEIGGISLSQINNLKDLKNIDILGNIQSYLKENKDLNKNLMESMGIDPESNMGEFLEMGLSSAIEGKIQDNVLVNKYMNNLKEKYSEKAKNFALDKFNSVKSNLESKIPLEIGFENGKIDFSYSGDNTELTKLSEKLKGIDFSKIDINDADALKKYLSDHINIDELSKTFIDKLGLKDNGKIGEMISQSMSIAIKGEADIGKI